MRYLVIMLIASLMFSCAKDNEEDEESTSTPNTTETAPEVPPSGSLVLSVDSLQTANLAFLGTNHAAAYMAVSVTNIAVALQLAVPSAAIKAALNSVPVFEGDRTWMWSLNFTSNATEFTAELRGTKTDTGVDWTMTVTRSPVDDNGCCTGFIWLTGSTTSNTQGEWKIYNHKAPTEATVIRTIAWRVDSETNKKITFTLDKILADDSNWSEGGYVDFLIDGTNLTYIIDQDPQDSAQVVAKWDSASKAGRVLKADGSTQCWDSNLDNVDCS